MRRFSLTAIMIYLVSLLPFPVLYMLSNFCYLVLYHVVGYRKKVVRENLQNAFPEKTASERLKIERKFYRYLPDLILEAIKMRTISARQVEKRFKLVNEEALERYLKAGRSVVGVTAHYGNWEWGLHRLSMSLKHPVLIIYKPLSNKSFDSLFNRIRARFGAIMVPMKQTLRQLVKYRTRPHISMFVADQVPTYHESNYFINFLNQPTLVFTGAARVAQRLDAVVIFCHINRVKRGYYECVFTTLTEQPDKFSVHELTDLHNRFTEDIIVKKPELWMWSHRRWKRKPRTPEEWPVTAENQASPSSS